MSAVFTKLFHLPGAKWWMDGQTVSLLPTDYGDIHIPFAGRLDLLQSMRRHGVEKHVHASDISVRLVLAHVGVRNHPEEVIEVLEDHRRNHSPDYYLQIRDRFAPDMPPAMAAADYIYISRNSYWGIIRMSADGRCTNLNARTGFNFSPESVRRHADFLRSTTLTAEDFAPAVLKAKAGDLVFLDPPYPLCHVHGSPRFTDEDHYHLAHVCRSLHRHGVLFIVTNGNTPFIRHIYRHFCISEIEAPRTLGRAKNGGRATELIITNY